MRNSILCISLTIVVLHFCSGEEKRAPTGFTALRGKKNPTEYVFADFENNFKEPSSFRSSTFPRTSSSKASQNAENPPPSLPWSDLPYYKRVPSGFFGLRGKKDVDLPIEETNKRIPTGFIGMRGKKAENQDFDDYLGGKRVVPSGLWELRGKSVYNNYYDDNNNVNHINLINDLVNDLVNDVVNDYVNDYVKRAPESRFFGMRGRRGPNTSGFFGVRGKKARNYDVRGKFVGVRGKKSFENENFNFLPEFPAVYEDGLKYNDLDLNQLKYLLSQNENN